MKIIFTKISGVFIIEPDVFEDDRGFFLESFNQKKFNDAAGEKIIFVQDNHSHSTQRVLRGLHYQMEPMAQGKLVRVVNGRIFDVAVDIRPESSTFKQWVGIELSAENKQQLWIPERLAHGFLTLSKTADVLYKATSYYSSAHDRSILWNDSTIGIEWPLEHKQQPLLSMKDINGESFEIFERKLKEKNL